jgi:hypothetical protein
MGSILIRKVPDRVHRKFKQACRDRKVSMEEAIVRLLAREVGEGRRGRPRTSGAKRRSASVKRGGRKGAKKTPRATSRKTVRRPARARRRGAASRTAKKRA